MAPSLYRLKAYFYDIVIFLFFFTTFAYMFLAFLPLSEPVSSPMLIFSIVLFIILGGPLILGKLKIPYIAGFILSGLILGSGGLNILARDSSFEIFGNVGLLYIMFLAGLDMDIQDIKRNTVKSLTFGSYTFLVPMILGTITGLGVIYYLYTQNYLGQSITWIKGYNLNKYLCISAILLASMYASHTLITYPIISRFGLTKKSYINATVGGTVVTTSLSLIILAVITGTTKGTLNSKFWIQLGVSIGCFVTIIFGIFPIIARAFLKKYTDSILQYSFVLAMVFFAAFLAQWAHLEPIIGAFFAGMALNKFIPKLSPLMNRIEFVGNALFIPYFLIGVGMLINMKTVFSSATTIVVAIIMTITATLSKFIAAWLTQKTFKMKKDERQIMFGLSNAQAAATLAAIIIGYNIPIGVTENGDVIRLISEEILNGSILMIFFTCAISSFITEKAASRLALETPEENVPIFDKEKRHILIPISEPETIHSLIELATLFRTRYSSESFYVANITNNDNPKSAEVIQGKKMLEDAAKNASAADIYVEKLLRYDTSVANGISNLVYEYNINVLILGLHKQETPYDPFFGKKTSNLLKKVTNAIYVYKSIQPINTIKRIMVAVPEKAEYEVGFLASAQRIKTLSQVLGAKMEFFASKNTIEQLKKQFHDIKTNRISYCEMSDWEEFLILSKDVEPNDLFVIVCSRKGSISYNPSFEKLPSQLSKYFDENSFIIAYPEQLETESKEYSTGWNSSQYREFTI